MLERNIEKRVRLINRLKQDGCCLCGLTERSVLEFHHVIETNKNSISRMVYGAYGERAFLEELTKCLVVCANDHKRIHAGIHRVERIPRYTVDYLYMLLHKED